MNDEQAVELAAQWALWGADADDNTYRILMASAGDLTEWDFADIIGRYGIGTADRLPQYTAFWVPDAEGSPSFVGIAIQERASFAAHDDRSHYDASGREITYSRLFCVRYADLARHRVTFAELLGATEQWLPPRGKADPVTLRIARERPRQSPPSPGPGAPDLARVVAALLLTTRPVCVLGADELPAIERLAFVDRVLSLLPYGLRATLSAATWASPTARDLKLRLFFASARRDDGSGTYHVQWGQRGWEVGSPPDSEVVRQYLAWLDSAGTRALELLEEQIGSARFSAAELPALVGALPKNMKVSTILRDLADSLREGDGAGAMAELRHLKPYKAGSVSPADRQQYRSQVLRYGLLGNRQGLRPNDNKTSLFRTLLQLAFEFPLSYDDYCAIVDSIGGPPHGKLRSALLDLKFASYVPRLLACKAESRFTDEQLMAELDDEAVPPAAPIAEFQRDLAHIRLEHRPAVYDFAVGYLRAYAEDPEAELRRRGYLAEILAAAFPEDLDEQRGRLTSALRFVHGESLSRGQIRDLFAEPGVRFTPAFEAAVAELAASSTAGLRVAELAGEARARQAAELGRPAPDGRSERGHDRRSWQQRIRRLVGGEGVAE